MRKNLFFLCLLLVSCSSGKIQLSDFKLRSYTEIELSNGLKVLFVPDKSLPSVTFAIMFKAGRTADPIDKEGLASLTAHSISEGTRNKSVVQYADALSQFGSSLNVSVTQDYTYLSVNSLSTNQNEVLDLFVEALLEPAFRTKDVMRRKKKMISEIKKEVDNPSLFASLVFKDYIYDKHPYGVPVNGTLKSLKDIKKKDVIKHFIKYFKPNNAVLAVVGRYTSDISSLLEKKLGKWKSGKNIPKVSVNHLKAFNGIHIRVVNKPELVQAQIRLGHRGVPRRNPDYLKLKLANTILGDGFSSRLVDHLRQNLGFTYSVSSLFNSLKETGTFQVYTFTKNETVGKMIQETLKVLKTFREKGVTIKEVSAARSQLIGEFPEIVETAENLAINLMALNFYGVGSEYLLNYQRNLAEMSVRDINDVIQKYFTPENLKILIYSSDVNNIQLIHMGAQVEIKSYKDYLN